MRPRYAKGRPTSESGADHVRPTLALRARAVLAVIIARGGATIAEIKRELNCDASQVSGRIANLRDDFDPPLIEDSGEKRAVVSPVSGIVWKSTPHGRAAFNGLASSTVKKTVPAIKQLPLDFSR
jgi:hypothetical protein